MGILAASSALVTGRWIQRTWRSMKYTAELTGESPFTYYSPGGFEPQMTRREAALILGIREFSTPEEVKTAHRRVMIANHPDRGGSPFLALKINEASALLRGPPK